MEVLLSTIYVAELCFSYYIDYSRNQLTNIVHFALHCLIFSRLPCTLRFFTHSFRKTSLKYTIHRYVHRSTGTRCASTGVRVFRAQGCCAIFGRDSASRREERGGEGGQRTNPRLEIPRHDTKPIRYFCQFHAFPVRGSPT